MKMLKIFVILLITYSSLFAGKYKYPTWIEAQRNLYGHTKIMEKTLEKYKEIADRNPFDCEAQYKVAELTYYLWEQYSFEKKSDIDRTRLIKIGVKYSKRALKLDPNSVPALFWMVANIGVYSLMKGPQNVLNLAPKMRRMLLRISKLDPEMKFERGSWGRILGKLYTFMPPFPMSFGNINKAIELLTEAYNRYPDYGINIYFLAEGYVVKGEIDKAEVLLKKGEKILENSDLTLFVNRKDLRIIRNLLKLIDKYKKEGKRFIRPDDLTKAEHL